MSSQAWKFFLVYLEGTLHTGEWIFKIERIIHLFFKNGKLICHKIPLPLLRIRQKMFSLPMPHDLYK